MAARRLDPEEQALWQRVAEGVRPLVPRRDPARAKVMPLEPAPAIRSLPAKRPGRVPPPLPPRLVATAPSPPDTLDGGWDRRLRRGMLAPDRSIDLHGHTLLTAHAALDGEIARALAQDDRLLLVVTGRPPREREAGDTPRRGAIRAAIFDWLAGSRHAARIAAVRNAHPRHGGAGALYVILRRRRGDG